MEKVVYKGYEILPAPNQLADSGKWTLNIHIALEKGYERVWRPFDAADTFPTEDEAIKQCINFGRRIIDGEAEGLSVEDL